MATIEVKRYSLWAQPCRLSAVQYIRRLRGGTQAHLVRASDDRLYVTKFKNNPHRTRALASEFLATRIGLWLGLPMPRIEVIQVSDAFIADTAELRIQRGTKLIPCRSGLQMASLYVPDIEEGSTFDELTRSRFQRVVNHHDAEMLLRLIDHLYKRRSSIRELITSFRTCSSNPFPRWRS